MKEQLIEFKTAKLAKEKGFDWHDDDTPWINNGSSRIIKNGNFATHPAPTQSLLQKWLRETQKISISIICGMMNGEHCFECWITDGKGKECEPMLSHTMVEKYGTTYYELTYEEALEKGLQEALTLIKTQ